MRDLHGPNHDHWRDTVRKQMAKHDPAFGQTKADSGLDIFATPFHERGAANGARVIGPLHEHQRDNGLIDALAKGH